MFNRRLMLGFATGAVAALASLQSFAQDWKSKYPELIFAAIPAENSSSTSDRYQPLADYLTKQLGVPVKLEIVADYAGVIEGQRSGQVHIAYYSPASYSRAYVTGVKAEPFAEEVNADGTKGYYSVFYVNKDSPYRTIQDLKGKALGLADPNSTSGNNVPRYALYKLGIHVDKFFSKVIYTGSHENAIIALHDGTVDVAANFWNSDEESNLKRMEIKGTPGIKYSDYRIIFKSDPIVNSPIAYLSDLPDDLKKAIREAFYDMEKNDKAAFEKFSAGRYRPWVPVDHKEYESTVELIKFVDELRKKRS
jgi:phosphonate transport system substrate-binding protein